MDAGILRSPQPTAVESDWRVKHILCAGKPAIFALICPKPPLGSFTKSKRSSLQEGPPRDSIALEGLRRLLPEPTPSPRLWAASPGATPTRLCEHTMRALSQPAN